MTPAITMSPTPSRKFQIDTRFVGPILISAILIIGHLFFGILEDWRKTVTCFSISIIIEMAIGYFIVGRLPHLASAWVGGISCGILVRSPEWWPYLVAPCIAILSKYVIRLHGRHLWNPSNFAVAALLLIAPQTVASLSIQWGNHVLPMMVIWLFGGVIVYRLNRFHISGTYVLFFFLFAALRALLSDDASPLLIRVQQEIAPITGPMYQLFVLFMITDPKTTMHSKKGQTIVAFLVAGMECALRYFGPRMGLDHIATHAPYYALTIMGPSSNLLEILWNRKAKAPSAGITPTPATA